MSGLAIYRPKGKAGEYASWACNLYVGCSNDCAYCYCKRGPLGTIWSTVPRLKKCFRNEEHAYSVFVKELEGNLDSLRREGLFFTFTTDPFLPETLPFTWNCILTAIGRRIPVTVLTKRADFVDAIHVDTWIRHENLALGFTLTGCDDLEGGASPNADRIAAMERLHGMGFRTFASLEPVIDPEKTAKIYEDLVRRSCCDLVKVGLESGRKDPYDDAALRDLHGLISSGPIPAYFKHSFTDRLGLPKEDLKDVFRL